MLLPIMGNDVGRPYVMMVNDLTYYPLLGMEVDYILLLPIIGKSGGRSYVITVEDITLLPIIGN